VVAPGQRRHGGDERRGAAGVVDLQRDAAAGRRDVGADGIGGDRRGRDRGVHQQVDRRMGECRVRDAHVRVDESLPLLPQPANATVAAVRPTTDHQLKFFTSRILALSVSTNMPRSRGEGP